MRDACSGYKTYIQVLTKVAHFLETFVSLSPVHQSPYLVPLLRKLTPVHIGTPTIPRPILIHFLYIHIYVSQEATSFQISSSKFCMKVLSVSCVLHSQPISCGFATTPVHVGSVTKQLMLWRVFSEDFSLLSTIPQIPHKHNEPITQITRTTYPSTASLSRNKKLYLFP